jgi:8-oxo-dGTP pyrophosphatase MutT (NUDIX family)
MIPNEQQLQTQAEQDGRSCTVSRLIRNGRHQLFLTKRAVHSTLFPNCWDIIGGHVEPDETLTQAFARVIHEEAGWQLKRVVRLVAAFGWELIGRPMREFCYLVEVEGEWERPQLEQEKFSAYRWLGENDLKVLKENREAGDWMIYNMVKQVLSYIDVNSASRNREQK